MNLTVAWRRSSYCESNTCLYVAVTPDGVLVRATGGGAELRYSAQAWRALCEAAKDGTLARLRT